ncbi:hypothetical protein ACH4E8_30105 [Streptomyces sp. NPDC017979]|uniref:hypothetical protein n=1 Tax=Streptomyces sp. NPDC017979 TaxID=3365024 RepID=UPI0037A9C7E6
MTGIAVPGQAGAEPDRGGSGRPAEPATSDACRLLCVGAHADPRYRAQVIDELYVHQERFTAPSFGYDAARVLAHALLARRTELAWALGILALWVIAVPLSDGYFFLLLLPSLVLALVGRFNASAAGPRPLTRGVVLLARWYARLMLALMSAKLVVGGVTGLFIDPPKTKGTPLDEVAIPDAKPSSDSVDVTDGIWPFDGGDMADEFNPVGHFNGFDGFNGFEDPAPALLAVFLYALIIFLVGLRRAQSARVITGPLSAVRFPDVAGDPAEAAASLRGQRIMAEIRREQHSPLTMYHSANPFRGAGTAFKAWSLAVELRPRADAEPVPLNNQAVLERIRPLVEALRTPAPGSAETAETVRDRLRELRIDECVFLPADGIPDRDGAPYEDELAAEHLADAVEEGGEARRHFLRVRVGGWEEDVVVTVFVRVHTQGGILMLEVAPHVLAPVKEGFREAERDAHRYAYSSTAGKLAWAVTNTPASVGTAVFTLYSSWLGLWEQAMGGHGDGLPEGPVLSVRERGSKNDGSPLQGEKASLFQEMDVSRYLKSIQDRITDGVSQALREAGWQTEEFEQKIVHVSGGVYIDSASHSAFGFGDQSTATVTNVSKTQGKGRELVADHDRD